jgi:DNA invertase Pin-like site-specific DNA recombinase
MIYGYARVSDKTQKLDSQIDELKKYGCDQIVTEVISGIAEEKKLNELVQSLQKGDTLVVTRVDRLGRNTLQLLQLINELQEKEVNLVILNLGMDTRTPVGQAVLAFLAAISQMERDILREKQKKGIEAARRRGTHLGRPRKWTKEGMELAIQMYKSGIYTVAQIEAATQVSRASLYRALKQQGISR